MILGGPRDGDVACRLYSLVQSCKESGVDPQAYLEDVLGKLGTTPMSEITSLTPWGWTPAAQGVRNGWAGLLPAARFAR